MPLKIIYHNQQCLISVSSLVLAYPIDSPEDGRSFWWPFMYANTLPKWFILTQNCPKCSGLQWNFSLHVWEDQDFRKIWRILGRKMVFGQYFRFWPSFGSYFPDYDYIVTSSAWWLTCLLLPCIITMRALRFCQNGGATGLLVHSRAKVSRLVSVFSWVVLIWWRPHPSGMWQYIVACHRPLALTTGLQVNNYGWSSNLLDWVTVGLAGCPSLMHLRHAFK